jgi:homoserine kinase type II
MASSHLDLAARAVLGRFGVAPSFPPAPLGNHGGFSGARLWLVEGPGGPYCLRAWPPGGVFTDYLTTVHRLLNIARQAGLDFVPAVQATPDQHTWVKAAGRSWDLTSWLPGTADFHTYPIPARLESACRALARLHLAWAGATPGHGPCPALRRRLDRCREWQELLASGWRPALDVAGFDPVAGWAERAWRVLRDRLGQVPARLAPWVGQTFPLQPCLCDVWHDHVLFEGDRVTGLVDYGSVKVDHVSADLARLLGSLVGDDRQQYAAGLAAYAGVRPLADTERALVAALDETGTVLGLANWLKWLYHDGRVFEDRPAVAARLAALVGRMEGWK